jgi:hypothetical protein
MSLALARCSDVCRYVPVPGGPTPDGVCGLVQEGREGREDPEDLARCKAPPSSPVSSPRATLGLSEREVDQAFHDWARRSRSRFHAEAKAYEQLATDQLVREFWQFARYGNVRDSAFEHVLIPPKPRSTLWTVSVPEQVPDMDTLKIILVVFWMLSSDAERDAFYTALPDIRLTYWYHRLRTTTDYSWNVFADVPDEQLRPGELQRGYMWRMTAICVNWPAMEEDQQSTAYAKVRARLLQETYARRVPALWAY